MVSWWAHYFDSKFSRRNANLFAWVFVKNIVYAHHLQDTDVLKMEIDAAFTQIMLGMKNWNLKNWPPVMNSNRVCNKGHVKA
jgi:hypothetical protein